MVASLFNNVMGNFSPQVQSIIKSVALILALLTLFGLMIAIYKRSWSIAAWILLSGVLIIVIGIAGCALLNKFGTAGAQTVNQSVNAFMLAPVAYSLILLKGRFAKVKRHNE